jgi:transcriptional antiterminator RfaH
MRENLVSWYAVYTKPRQEHIARENLERQSFEAYLPLMRVRRRRRDKWVDAVEPMFSRYLFIRLALGTTNVASIRSTRGVTGLVQSGNALVQVPESFISVLLQTADSGTGVHTPEPDLLKEGDTVVLTDGPLANLRGIFRASDGDARAIILLTLLGTETEVAVPLEQVWRQA